MSEEMPWGYTADEVDRLARVAMARYWAHPLAEEMWDAARYSIVAAIYEADERPGEGWLVTHGRLRAMKAREKESAESGWSARHGRVMRRYAQFWGAAPSGDSRPMTRTEARGAERDVAEDVTERVAYQQAWDALDPEDQAWLRKAETMTRDQLNIRNNYPEVSRIRKAALRFERLLYGDEMPRRPLTDRRIVRTDERRRSITDAQLAEARALYAQGGWTYRKLADRYHVDHSALARWMKGIKVVDKRRRRT